MSYLWNLAVAASRNIEQQMIWYEADEARGGAELANRWNALLGQALVKLAEAPCRHPFAPENGRWMRQHEVRQMRFRPWRSGVGWRVLYTVDEERKLVTVLQVRHEHRRWLHEAEQEDQPQ